MSALVPGLLWLLALGFLLKAYGFRGGAATVPVLVGWLMLVLTTLDLATRLPNRFGAALKRALNPAQPHANATTESSTWRQGVAMGGLIGFMVALLCIGIMPSIALFMLPALRFGAGQRWWVSALGAAAMVLVVWAVFARLLGLELYPGLFFDAEG